MLPSLIIFMPIKPYLPVFIFLMLLQNTDVEFFVQTICRENSTKVSHILREIKNPIIGYKVGLISGSIVIAVLNSETLLVPAVLCAILLGVSSALWNILPYMGVIISIGDTMRGTKSSVICWSKADSSRQRYFKMNRLLTIMTAACWYFCLKRSSIKMYPK